jgi:hypothetical protein
MTPLQQAAQAVIARWESPLWKYQLHTSVYIAELRKALEAEQAPAVEPCKGHNCGSINPKLHSAECFDEHEALAGCQRPFGYFHFVFDSDNGDYWRETDDESEMPLFTHPAQTPAGERAELIADLRLNHEYCPKEVILEAADMLEADVSLINEGNKAQQVAVPMTEAQIFACDPVPHVMFDQQRIDFARAIEAFHGITGAKS